MTAPEQLPLDFGHRTAMGAEDFLVAPSNAQAVAWLDRWPNWPGPALIVHGPAGCGKTHLTQVWSARSHAPRVVPAELDRAMLPELLAPTGTLAVDDADSAAGNPEAERALFHLYNLARENGGHLLLTGALAPVQWPVVLPDLRSRLLAAPSAEVGMPDDTLLAGADVVEFLVARMERSFDTARRLVADLDAAALAAHRRITVPLARNILGRTV
jgi:chromosomal replication initiation ATPase DnaA